MPFDLVTMVRKVHPAKIFPLLEVKAINTPVLLQMK